MNPSLFAALSAAVGGIMPRTTHISVVDTPQFTTNYFGPIDEVAGKRLQLLSRNPQGDCLCIFEGKKGTNLVDVDYRDVAK